MSKKLRHRELSPGPKATGARRSRKARRSRWWRRLGIAAGILLLLGIALWLAREPIAARLEAAAVSHLHEEGIYPRYASRSWLPWRGIRFENVVLDQDATGRQPAVEMSNFTVAIPWTELWHVRSMVSRWHTHDARITLHDTAGAIVFEHVTSEVWMRGDQLEVRKVAFRYNPVEWLLSGKLILGSSPGQAPAAPRRFSPDFGIVRAVLARLDFRRDTGRFNIQGTFHFDLRPADPVWESSLKATGDNVQWFGIPVRHAKLEAQLSDHGIHLSPDVQWTKGSSRFTASRTDWADSPLAITGQISDAKGSVDFIAGRYEHTTGAVVIKTLTGPADLAEFVGNFPSLTGVVPSGLRIRIFPEIAMKDASWTPGEPSGNWSVGSLKLQSKGDFALPVAGRTLTIARLQGEGSCKDKAWRFQATTGALSWGEWAARDSHVTADLTAPREKLDCQFGLNKGRIAIALADEGEKVPAWSFKGTLADAAGLSDRFAGRFELASQTVLVTQLDGKANLLEIASNFPATATLLVKGVHIRTFPDLAVKDFSYKTGAKTADWRIGTVQVRNADLTVDVKGKPLAIDRLTGSAGFDGKGWRLAQMSGQALGGGFTMDGRYETGTLREATIELNKCRLEQFAPWFDAARGSAGEGLLSLTYRGSLGTEPARMTGAGTLELANAPLVKVPLLDQTYDFFGALVPGVKRNGAGQLTSTFKVINGVFDISQFEARGDAITVTAKGKLDLVRKEVDARAFGNLRGVAGLATLAVSRTLEMKVSGPLDQIHIQPAGPVGMVGGTIGGAAKAAGGVLETGIKVPLKIFDLFKGEPPKR